MPRGKCPRCLVRYLWPEKAGLVAHAYCPRCGAKLQRYLSGGPAFAMPESPALPRFSQRWSQAEGRKAARPTKGSKRMAKRKLTDNQQGDRLRSRRLALNLSQAELAETFGIAAETLSRWEHGRATRWQLIDLALQFLEQGKAS